MLVFVCKSRLFSLIVVVCLQFLMGGRYSLNHGNEFPLYSVVSKRTLIFHLLNFNFIFVDFLRFIFIT